MRFAFRPQPNRPPSGGAVCCECSVGDLFRQEVGVHPGAIRHHPERGGSGAGASLGIYRRLRDSNLSRLCVHCHQVTTACFGPCRNSNS